MRYVVTARSGTTQEVIELLVEAPGEEAAARTVSTRGDEVLFIRSAETPSHNLNYASGSSTEPAPAPFNPPYERAQRRSAYFWIVFGFIVMALGVGVSVFNYEVAATLGGSHFKVYWGVVVCGIVLIAIGAARLPPRRRRPRRR